ncbi:MAG: DoxX family protein [Acidimicrobiales bacterium]
MNTGLLILRVIIGLLLVGHGTQKLFRWFGGYGLAGTGGFFDSLGLRPGKPMAITAGVAEAGGGALLAVGLFTPLGAAAVVGTMLVAAVSVHGAHGLWSQNNGYEYPLVLGAAAAALGFTGAGRFSLDRAFDLDLAGGGWGVAALAAGVVGGATVELYRRRNLANAPAAAATA